MASGPGAVGNWDQPKRELLVSKIEFNGNRRPANQHHKRAGVVPSGAYRPQFTPSPPRPELGPISSGAPRADLRNGALDSLVALRPHQPGARGGLTCGLPTAREPGDLAVRSVILGMIGAVLRMRPKSENKSFSVVYGDILQCLLACFRQMLLVAQAAWRRSGDCTRKSSGWAVDRPAPSIHAGRPLCTDV